jgi:hypothetical protein
MSHPPAHPDPVRTHRIVRREDLLNIAEYEKARPEFRGKILAIKDLRRLSVGPNFTFLFENFDTILYQVQEMMRVERMVDERAIVHEIETYNELIPRQGEISATLLLEYDSRELREKVLPDLKGIEKHVWLEAADLGRIPADFDTRQMGDERVSSVQYLKFTFTAPLRQQWRALGAAGRLQIAVDHANYRHSAPIPPKMAEALAADAGVG